MKLAIIGMGYLGTQLAWELKEYDPEPIVTHRLRRRVETSLYFDIFRDDVGKILGEETETVLLPAKIEFTQDSAGLKAAMKRFVKGCGRRRLVYFSSAGICDGMRGMYTEKDKSLPTQLYGRNLAICEKVVWEEAYDFCIIRPDYIYGSISGSDRLDGRLARAVEAMSEDVPYERYTDMFRSPMHVRQVARASALLTLSDFQGIVHVAGPRMSVYDFTRQGLEALGVLTKNLVGVPIPANEREKLLLDVSLDTGLMTQLTGIEPMGVLESFRSYGGTIP